MSSKSVAHYFPWSRVKVTGQSVAAEADLAVVRIEPDFRYNPVCSKCGCKGGRIHQWHNRAIRDLNVATAQVFINVNYRNVQCPGCGSTRVEDLEFVRPRERITERLARYAHGLCKVLPTSQVAQHLNLDWKTVKRLDKRFLEDRYGETNYEDLRLIGVDEIAVRKGHNYLTIVLDYESGRVVWVGEGRKAKTLKRFFAGMTKKQKSCIEAVTMDMWDPYIKAVNDNLPEDVEIVFDLFHVVSAFNKVIDKVRNAEYRKAKGEHKEVLKGSKYLLLSNVVRRKKARQQLERILELNETISTMLVLKVMLKRIWGYKYRAWAQRRLEEWCEMARSVGYECVSKFASRLENYSYGILNHCDYPIGTSRLEGCNNKIKFIKRQAYGYHDVRYFALKIIQAFDPT